VTPLSGALALLLLLIIPLTAEARDPKVVDAFRKTHPCPSTGKTTGPCPGWVADHAYPLCAGGNDSVENLVWQDVKGSYLKDRIERELCVLKHRPPCP
jgi:hypothetical protein